MNTEAIEASERLSEILEGAVPFYAVPEDQEVVSNMEETCEK